MAHTKENLATGKLIYQLFNERKIDEAARHVSPDCLWTNVSTGESHRGPAGFKDFAQGWITAFSDARCDIQDQYATEDRVITEFIGRGTHDGPLSTPNGPVPATRRKMDLQFCEILTLKAGKVTGARLYFDVATMMRQLGLLPEAAGMR